jgi:hypothetical protein
MGPNIYAEEILLHAYAAYSGHSARAEGMHEFHFFDQSDNTGDDHYAKMSSCGPRATLAGGRSAVSAHLGREQSVVIYSFRVYFIQSSYILRKINVAMIIITWYLVIARINIYSSSRTGSSIPASNILFLVFRGSSACLALSSGVTSSMSTLLYCSCSTMSPILSITRSLSIGADGSCSHAALLADTVPVAAAVAI